MKRSPGDQIDVRVAAVEEIAIGRFRCAPDHPSFGDTGPIGGWLVVFPRTSVWITHAGREPVIADSTRAILYNRGQEYRRAKITEEGDRCEWFSFSPSAIAEAGARFVASLADEHARPFRATHATVDARTYALQRQVFEHVTCGAAIDPLFVEETSLAVLARVVASLYDGAAGAPPIASRARTAREHAELADAVKQLLASRLTEPLSLAAIAREVGRSPFHLARVFEAHAGLGVHAYRTQLRLRASLERVAAGEDLTTVALDLGFSSHSHFTAAFAQTFGRPPSDFRGSSKISKARARGDRSRFRP